MRRPSLLLRVQSLWLPTTLRLSSYCTLIEDKRLVEAFTQGEDIHAATAAEIFAKRVSEVTPEQRRFAKAINFGLIYGMSAFGLARELAISRQEASLYIDRYFKQYLK